MAPQFIYSTRKLARFYPPDRTVLENISLSFYPGAKIGVIGPNGSGKSSLLRIMAGLDDGFTGEARLTPGFSVGYLEQEPHLDEGKDVLGNVMDGVAPVKALLDDYNDVLAKWGDPDVDFEKVGARQAELEDKIGAADAWDLERNVEIAMDALRCPPGDADVATLSGGERRRVALCRLLLSHPDLLLLDEPTNHLDAESVAWLERFLQEYAGTVVAITHDRYFLDNVAQWILELDRGRGFPFEGNYCSWLEQKQARLALEEKQASARQRTLQRELEWVRMAPQARQAKGRARLTAYEKLQAEAEADRGARRQARDRHPRRAPPGRHRDRGRRTSARASATGSSSRTSPSRCPGPASSAIIGPNGAGKTTLFRMITGEEAPDAGTVEGGRHRAAGLRRPEPRQPRSPTRTVYEEITGGVDHLQGRQPRDRTDGPTSPASTSRGPTSRSGSATCRAASATASTWPSCCARAATCCCSTSPPTTSTSTPCGALEDGLESFPGCAVVISHDRWFLDRIATHVLAFEGDSQVRWFEGNFSEYEAVRHKELGAEADQPHRIKYKPLAR